MVPLALLLLAVNVYAVRRSLLPLARAAGEAAVLDARRGGLRLSAGDDLPREVHALVGAVNAALGRADEVLRFQREFTANVAHELRTPLAVLLLQLDEIGGPAAEAAKSDIQAMSRLVDQLLRVAQIEGMSAEPPTDVDLAEVGRGVVQQLAPIALDRGRETEFRDQSASIIQGHRDAIAGAVRNLVDNALRAAPKGSLITVSAGPGPVIEVCDQGPGIDPALRRDLFDRFAQGDRRTRGSAGLGLAIVAKTMEIHDGSVTVADRPGGGTLFRLVFPDQGPFSEPP
ncbi:histidine kinase [Skermanella aerolata KACC 11604]|nr:histidine kinase [Skermanella aerolata KACC 11604]